MTYNVKADVAIKAIGITYKIPGSLTLGMIVIASGRSKGIMSKPHCVARRAAPSWLRG